MDDTLIQSLRIDTPIKIGSIWRNLLYVGLTVGLMLLAWSATLSLVQYALLAGISIVTAICLVMSQTTVLHLSQPLLSQRVDQGWQLLIRTSLGDELWQADLVTVNRYPLLIHLKFKVIEPHHRTLSVTIFCDQVSDDEWRELNVLATTMGKTT